MGLVFFIILLVWGWAEMSAFIYIGSKFGGLLTLLGIFFTAAIGIALLKQQGLSVINRIQTEIRDGQTPVKSIADSISLVFGSIFMLIPGYVTDAVGLVLFIPIIRTIAGIYLLKVLTQNKRFSNYVHVGGSFDNTVNAYHRTPHDHEIIEGEFEERTDRSKHLPKG